ncbi:MAG: NAD(P)H-hydrate dehydratase [Bacteroidia bacterium]|nr:NAD(P)H-hydrate dehydratase [Bacteroidia bacterium]MCZ2277348.1 NAD(P)H-hydrate dehydratase [Bacteroidia bacterium]
MIPVLSAEQIRQWDSYTIRHEPVASVDLMERAATACFRWLVSLPAADRCFQCYVFNGNNGGDGLAIARMLHLVGYRVNVFEIHSEKKPTVDFLENKNRLLQTGFESYHIIKSRKDLSRHADPDILIDAIFGTGLSKPVTGLFAEVIKHINFSGNQVISIDMPSGLFVDSTSLLSGHTVIRATHTLTFELLRKSLLFAENNPFFGEVHVLPIGLMQAFINNQPVTEFLVEYSDVQQLRKARNPFSNKGHYGHAAIVAGSYGMMGAALLASRACLKAGAGLTTAIVPACGYSIIQGAVPEVMCITPQPVNFNSDAVLHNKVDIPFSKFSTIGIGPGIGQQKETRVLLNQILTKFTKPLVIDADALNILSANPSMLKKIPAQSILTPHPKEFERLAGKSKNDFHRHEMQQAFSEKYQVLIVLKGRYTCITTPEGRSYFNTTGNAGMAKGGSGDVLTGFITGLLARGYSPEEAAIAGVYLHGSAGNLACNRAGEEAMTASDLINELNCQQ